MKTSTTWVSRGSSMPDYPPLRAGPGNSRRKPPRASPRASRRARGRLHARKGARMKKLLIAAAAVAAAAALGAAETEKTIPMPKREQVVKINFASDQAKIDTLEIQHYPDSDDVEKARTKDLND